MKIQNNLLCCYSSTVGVTSALIFTELVIVSFDENQPQGNQQLIYDAEGFLMGFTTIDLRQLVILLTARC